MKNIAATPPKMAARTPINTVIWPDSVDSIGVPEPVEGLSCAAVSLFLARMVTSLQFSRSIPNCSHSCSCSGEALPVLPPVPPVPPYCANATPIVEDNAARAARAAMIGLFILHKLFEFKYIRFYVDLKLMTSLTRKTIFILPQANVKGAHKLVNCTWDAVATCEFIDIGL